MTSAVLREKPDGGSPCARRGGLPLASLFASSTAVLLVADCADAGGRHVLTADEDEEHGKENVDEWT